MDQRGAVTASSCFLVVTQVPVCPCRRQTGHLPMRFNVGRQQRCANCSVWLQNGHADVVAGEDAALARRTLLEKGCDWLWLPPLDLLAVCLHFL